MFARFQATYGPTRDTGSGGAIWQDAHFAGVAGYADFAGEFAGASFASGLYRFHDAHSGPEALASIAEAFPEFAERALPFGYDWLGRHFAVDFGRVAAGEPRVLLLEPGTGEVLEIPASFAAFHEQELLESPDAALASDFFKSWAATNVRSLPLRRDQCVGYKIPLFLGGEDTVENLEVTDLEVYWSIFGQLRRQVGKR